MTTSSNCALRGLVGGGVPERSSESAFTMIEIVIVVAIILVLATLALVARTAIMGQAYKKATQSRIERLKLHIEEYRSITGNFPPDGYDSKVENDDGMELKGSAALYHALSQPIEEQQMVGGVPRMVHHDPIAKFTADEISPEIPEYPGVREIVDGWGVPMHYDNTLDGFSPQGGEAHYPPLVRGEHPPDVRTLEKSEGGVSRPGQPQSRAYDLWSHGADGHEMFLEGERRPPVATWNLKAKE